MNDHFSLDRIRNKTLLVRQMMQLFFIRRHRQFVPAVADFWVERDQTDPWHAVFVLGHHADGFILVVVNLESMLGRQVKKREHVAT